MFCVFAIHTFAAWHLAAGSRSLILGLVRWYANSRALMETFNVDFSDEGLGKLSRSVGQRMKAQLAQKLAAAGLGDRVKLTFTENGHGVPADLHFAGSADDVAKAKEALGIDCEPVQNDSKEP